MIVSAAVVLLVGFLVATSVVRHRRAAGEPGEVPGATLPTAPGSSPVTAPAALSSELSRWVEGGLLSAEQASAIAQFEAARRPAPVASAMASRRVPALAETLGYIGAVLAVTGIVLIIVRYWPDMSTPARLGLSGSLAILLGAGGALVHEALDAAYARLRGVLWLASTASAGLFAIVGARALHRGGDQRAELAVLVGALAVSGLSGVMWNGRLRPLQEMATFAGAVVAVGAALRLVATSGAMGLGVLVCGAALVALSLTRKVTMPFVADLVGVGAILVGGVVLTNFSLRAGGPLAAVCAAGLIGLALAPRVALDASEERLYAIVGVLAMLQTWPMTLNYYAHDAGLLTGGVVWVIGALALAAALRARVRSPLLLEWGASLVMLLGAAITQAQFASLAPALGLATALGLMVLGSRPGGVMLTFVGSVGLLVNVPWLVVRLFPGQVRAPVVIVITGALFVGLAVLLSRERGRLHDVMSGHGRGGAKPLTH
jgi:hypothetical protein